MSASPDVLRDRELVRLARQLERLRARRRRQLATVRQTDAAIRECERFLRGLLSPLDPSMVERAAELGRLGAFGAPPGDSGP